MTEAPVEEGRFTGAALALPAPRAVGLLLLDRLDRVVAARQQLDDPRDPDALHQFRVALRRLRSLIRAYGKPLDQVVPRRLRRGFRRLARATGASRDLEVKRAWLAEQQGALRPRDRTGLRWLDRRLADEKEAADDDAFARINRDLPRLAADLRTRLEQQAPVADGPPLARVTAALLRVMAAELARHLERVRTVSDQDEAHAARIAGKRIRYLLEPFAGVLPDVAMLIDEFRAFQDVLGDMHDADVAATLIAEAMEAAARQRGERVAQAVREGDVMDQATLRRERRRDPMPGLIALAGLVQARRDDEWQTAEAEWLRAGRTRLLGPVEAAARELDACLPGPAEPPMEYERKYLLRGLPPRALEVEPLEIEQGYLPGERIHERIRRTRGTALVRCTRTVKLGAGIAREEYEESATEAMFQVFWPLTAGRRVLKRRYRIQEGGLVWEIDAFRDRDLVLAEVELPDAHREVALPEWLAEWVVREVTEEAAYVNLNLAK